MAEIVKITEQQQDNKSNTAKQLLSDFIFNFFFFCAVFSIQSSKHSIFLLSPFTIRLYLLVDVCEYKGECVLRMNTALPLHRHYINLSVSACEITRSRVYRSVRYIFEFLNANYKIYDSTEDLCLLGSQMILTYNIYVYLKKAYTHHC